MRSCSPEGTLLAYMYAGLQNDKYDQQAKGGNFISLLQPCETPSAVLHPGLRHPHKKDVECRSRPRGGHEDVQRAAAPLLKGKAEGAGPVQPREERALGKPHCSLPVLGGGS